VRELRPRHDPTARRPSRAHAARRLAGICAWLTLAAPLAHADIYAFTDAAGTTHYSNVPVDARYRLLIASANSESASKQAQRTDRWLSRSHRYDAAIRAAARASSVAPALVRAVILVESGFNPRAVSNRGAIGLMQLRPATAQRYGTTDAFDPVQNIRAGTRYLRALLMRYHSDLALALAAYNAGEDAVDRHGEHVPPYRETLNYVPSVLRVYQRLLDRAGRGA
jgi:soluble lytic murein transglycosylase-like protein